ncbi:exonuclease domain-containing protein [Paenibacillus sp.]|uniref:exonuclease domain-containing protein n=1 Tax=Paenibacillus sp. TaxID=58172 RepID=UPI002D3BCE02|nr:exonuclease domain-containing protein [Paenibacillus sp.]HZG87242.1 exonuclease domain-containing protein [Paenibacillus sp.]
MKDQNRPPQGMWSLYKMGGITPALNSVFNPQNARQMAFIRQVMKQQRKDFIMDTPLSDIEVVVFDLETTGFNASGGDEILSFGAVAAKGDVIREEETFYTLVNPERPIPANIVELTGITEDDVRGAPSVMEGLQQFFAFVDKRILVAHASAHDRQFLNAALWRTSKVHMTHRVLDTIMIAKWLEPKRTDYSLDALLEEHGIPITVRHHALEDSLMTARLWVSFLRRIRDRNIQTLGDLYSYLSQS